MEIKIDFRKKEEGIMSKFRLRSVSVKIEGYSEEAMKLAYVIREEIRTWKEWEEH